MIMSGRDGSLPRLFIVEGADMAFIRQEERTHFANELAALGGVSSSAVLRAFSTVPREKLLPPGPWIVEAIDGSYYATVDDDPSRILHAVGVAIDADRRLNSANPATVGRTLEAAEIRSGETVFHVGAGLGYFSAIIAELVGPTGRVIAAEIDPHLAKCAQANLAPWKNVEVVGDGLTCRLPPVDVVFASAGVAVVPRQWVEALRTGGRMILPMTGSIDGGLLFAFKKRPLSSWLMAGPKAFVRFYPCAGARDPSAVAAMDAAIADPRAPQVKSLRFDGHEREAACWLHGDDWCLTTKHPPDAPAAMSLGAPFP